MVKDYHDNLKLILLAQGGDKEAKDTLIENNTGLVWSIVRRFIGRNAENDDLFQIGCIGLIKAAEKFDVSYNVQFSTYAVPMIMGEIKRFLRDDGMIKISRSIKENAGKVMRESQRLQMELGREPTLQEISKGIGMDMEDIVVALEASTPYESLSTFVGGGDSKTLTVEDRLPTHNGESDMVERIALSQVLEGLEEMERILIEERYYKNKTQSEVAKRLGISQVQVSRLERKILKKIRKQME